MSLGVRCYVEVEFEVRARYRIRAEIYEKRATEETSLMAKGIYRAAARDSQD